MRKIIMNKKFLVAVGVCLSVAGGMALKNHISTKASDSSFEINGMNVSIQKCEGKSQEIMEEDIDETISNEVITLEEQGHNYEIGDVIETEHGDFHPGRLETEGSPGPCAALRAPGPGEDHPGQHHRQRIECEHPDHQRAGAGTAGRSGGHPHQPERQRCAVHR